MATGHETASAWLLNLEERGSAEKLTQLPLQPSTGPGRAKPPSQVRTILSPHHSCLSHFCPGGKYDLQEGRCEQGKIKEQVGVSLPTACLWPGLGSKWGRGDDVTLCQAQRFDNYIRLGLLITNSNCACDFKQIERVLPKSGQCLWSFHPGTREDQISTME